MVVSSTLVRSPFLPVICFVTFALTLWFFSSSRTQATWRSVTPISSSDNILDTQNATLGFQKIYVINFPGRTDKRDAIVLSAYFTGLDVEFVDAVVGSNVSLKAYPQDWPPKEPVGSIGTWRAHMNVYQRQVLYNAPDEASSPNEFRMIQDKVQTALIMEDDADWDVMLKSQMLEIARGARHIQDSLEPVHSPYGDKWDAMFVGHCGTNNRVEVSQPVDSRYWVIHDDPTVVPPRHGVGVRSPNQSPMAIKENDNRTRIMFSPYKVTCLQAYSVTFSGVSHILYDQALRPRSNVIDIAWSNMCKYRRLNMPIAVHPPIMGQHRQPGDGSRDSDRTFHNSTFTRKVGYSENVNFPMRLNLESFISGTELVKSQFPKETFYDTIDPKQLKLPTGEPATVAKEDFVLPPPGQPLSDARTAELDRGDIAPPSLF